VRYAELAPTRLLRARTDAAQALLSSLFGLMSATRTIVRGLRPHSDKEMDASLWQATME
jgi:hypothetical protein